MMMGIMSMIGYVIITLSVIVGLSTNNLFLTFLGVFAGLVLIAISKIVDYLHDLHTQALGLPWSDAQLRRIKTRSRQMKVISSSLQIHAEVDTEYPVLRLDGEHYVRVKALYDYLTQDGRTYTLRLPGREPILLSCAIDYFPRVEMFELDEQVYIRLSCLSQAGLTVKVTGEGLVIEN